MSADGDDLDNTRPAGTPVLDIERYRALIEGQFATPEQGDEFLRSLWFIMVMFIDFGMDVKESTERLPFMRELASAAASPKINCAIKPDKKTRKRAAKTAAKKDGDL